MCGFYGTSTPGLVALESSGADSSGLTEAMTKISDSVDVRLSEQQASCAGVIPATHVFVVTKKR